MYHNLRGPIIHRIPGRVYLTYWTCLTRRETKHYSFVTDKSIQKYLKQCQRTIGNIDFESNCWAWFVAPWTISAVRSAWRRSSSAATIATSRVVSRRAGASARPVATTGPNATVTGTPASRTRRERLLPLLEQRCRIHVEQDLHQAPPARSIQLRLFEGELSASAHVCWVVPQAHERNGKRRAPRSQAPLGKLFHGLRFCSKDGSHSGQGVEVSQVSGTGVPRRAQVCVGQRMAPFDPSLSDWSEPEATCPSLQEGER
jgi:hypothetical protein